MQSSPARFMLLSRVVVIFDAVVVLIVVVVVVDVDATSPRHHRSYSTNTHIPHKHTHADMHMLAIQYIVPWIHKNTLHFWAEKKMPEKMIVYVFVCARVLDTKYVHARNTGE